MKTISFRVMLMVAFMIISLLSAYAQLSYEADSRLYIGPRTYSIISDCPGVYITTEWNIENYEKGLNFTRGWPNPYYGNYIMFIDQTGKIGMGRKPTTYALEVNGQVWTSSGLLVASDKKLKKNIKNLSDSANYVEKLLKLNGKSYDKQIASTDDNAAEVAKMIDNGKIKKEDAAVALEAMNKEKPNKYMREIGFLAQDVQELFPELVEEDSDGILSVNYIGLIPLLLESIKEQQQTINTLLSKTDKLQKSISDPNSSLTSLNSTATETEIQAKLYQNSPNPFTNDTEIKFYIPQSVNTASLNIYDLQGKQLMQFSISQRGEGSHKISGHHFSAGMYLYSLIANGTVIDTKRMILTK